MIKSLKTSSISNSQDHRSMLAGILPSSEYLIDSRILETTAASVTFDNLSQYAGIYKHLQICFVAKSTNTDSNWWSIMTEINGDTGSNYAFHRLVGDGSTVTSSAGASTSLPRNAYILTNFSTNGFSSGIMDILDAYSSTKNKTFRTLSGVTGPSRNFVELNSVLWINSASINSIKFFIQSGGGNFTVGSRFSIYGVTA